MLLRAGYVRKQGQLNSRLQRGRRQWASRVVVGGIPPTRETDQNPSSPRQGNMLGLG